MKTHRTRGRGFWGCLVAGLTLAVGGMTVQASAATHGSYPTKPIQVSVEYPPGGATDLQARIVTELAKKYIGAPVYVVNHPGAGGQLGWDQFVTMAHPDGYTLAAYNIPSFLAQSYVYKTRYNIQNVIPVANWGADPATLIVPKSSPFKTVKQLVDYARAHPGKLTFSGAGKYTQHQLALIQFEKSAGFKATYVPYAGGVPALRAVIAGEVNAGFNNLSDATRNRANLRILAIAFHKRDSFLPKVPTLDELGYKVSDAASVNFRGIMAPAGTPPAIVAKLSAALVKMWNDPAIRAKMKTADAPMYVLDHAQTVKLWKQSDKKVHELLLSMKVKLAR